MHEPIKHHPFILGAWSNAVHRVLDIGRSEDLAQIQPPATKEMFKFWTDSIAHGQKDPVVPECRTCGPLSNTCWRCKLESDIQATLEPVEGELVGSELAEARDPIEDTAEEPFDIEEEAQAGIMISMDEILAKLPPAAGARLLAAKEEVTSRVRKMLLLVNIVQLTNNCIGSS